MRDKACIIKYENGIATVIPLLSDTCINCNSPTCAKRGTPFQASNPQNLKLKSGDIVKIEAPATTQIAQACLSLIVPILSAVAGYCLAEPVAKLWGIPVTESMISGYNPNPTNLPETQTVTISYGTNPATGSPFTATLNVTVKDYVTGITVSPASVTGNYVYSTVEQTVSCMNNV